MTMPTNTATRTLTIDELYQLRGLLSKLHDEPGLREQVGTWINGVYTLTSVLLDDRRQSDPLCTLNECVAAPRCSSGATVWHEKTDACGVSR